MGARPMILQVSWVILLVSGIWVATRWSLIATSLIDSGFLPLEPSIADHQAIKTCLFAMEGLGWFVGTLATFGLKGASGWLRFAYVSGLVAWGLFSLSHVIVTGIVS